MKKNLKDLQVSLGAIFDEHSSYPLSFGQDQKALSVLETRSIVCDRSHWGLIELTGEDRLHFLHNQTTNNLQSLKKGQGMDTVFVNSIGRTLDLATAYVKEESLWVLVSPNRRTFLMEWMDRYLFPMDKVTLKDISDSYRIFTLIGQTSSEIIKQLGAESLTQQLEGNHALISWQEIPIVVIVGSGLKKTGYTLIVSSENAPKLWTILMELDTIPAGEYLWESLRIHQGRPSPDHELTEDYNPLEVGLWYAISFNKGCYIGQETIARLNTYQGVKQKLWGLQLSEPVLANTVIKVGEVKVGILTSCSGHFGLGYIRTKAGGEGLTVQVGKATGKVVSVPFLSHEYYQSAQ